MVGATAPAQEPAPPPANPVDDLRGAIGEAAMYDEAGREFASAVVFWIAPDLAVTNWHVIHGAHAIVIRMHGGHEHKVTHLVGADERADAALLRAEPVLNGPPLALQTTLPFPGESVIILAPHSLFPAPDTALRGTVLRADELEFHGVSLFIHTPRAGPPGWSGAPILGDGNRVVGVMRAVGPAAGFGAPASVIESLRAAGGEGVPFQTRRREPTTRFGRSMALMLRARRMGPGKHDEKIKLLRQAVEESPDFWPGWGLLGVIAMGNEDLDTAIDAFEHGAALSPEARQGITLSDLYERRGRERDADAALARAIRTDPVGFLFVTERTWAEQMAQRGRYADALPILERSVAGQPEDVELRVACAQCLVLTGHPGDALPHLKYALERDPDFMPGHYATGLALLQMGRAADAIPPLKRAVELDGKSAPARMFLARALAQTGADLEAHQQVAALESIDKPLAQQVKMEIQAIRAVRGK